MALNQTDLDVRIQQAVCCAGKEAKKLSQFYMYGSDCKEEQLDKLTLLNAYIDILRCYNVQADDDTDWEYYIVYEMADGVSVGDVFEIFAGGSLLLSYTAASTNVCTVFNAIAAALTLITGVSGRATCGETLSRIVITVPCEDAPVFVKITRIDNTEVYIPLQVSVEGKCETGDSDNCVTEEQIETIVENIAKMCKICFQAPGFAYYTQD